MTRIKMLFIGLFLVLLCITESTYSQQEELNAIIAFKIVNLITMTSEQVVPKQTVVIEKDRIMEIGESGKVNIPEDAFIIDGTGKYLLPGLADMHTHYGGTLEKADLNLFVAYGVTTIRDFPQGSPPTLLKLRDEIKADKRFGPQIFVANHLMGIELDPSQSIRVSKNNGYDGVKLNSYFTTKEFLETIAEANKSGVYTLGHLPFLVSFEDILNSGFKESSHVLELAWYLTNVNLDSIQNPVNAGDQIFNNIFSQLTKYVDLPCKDVEIIYRPKIKAIVDKIGERDFSFCTTMLADYDIMNKVLNIDTIINSNYSQYISKSFWNDIKDGKDKHFTLFSSNLKLAAMIYNISCMILHELIAQKKFLVLGTDVGPTYLSYIPGISVHLELKLLVDNGLTPYEALLTATKNASIIANKMCGIDNFGSIEVGKRADLLLLENNPLIDITNTQNINGVLTQGKYYQRNKLDSIKNIQKQRIGNLITDQYKTGGIDEAIKLYHSLNIDNYFNKYYLSENTLIIPAYELLKMNLLEDALKLFLLNVEEYPNAPNAFDSMAEAYLKKGNKQLAIKNYKKALSIDPNFENSIKALKELEK